MKNKNLLLTGIVILGFATTTLAQTVPSYVPKTGLVSWWPFNGNANDESASENNGVVNGATLTTDRLGNANSAYVFDGINDWIKIPSGSSTSINITTNFSLTFWFKTAQGTNNAGIIGFGDNISATGGYLAALGNGQYPIGSALGKMTVFSKDLWYKGTSILTNNTWHFACITLNSSTLSIIIDNKTDATFTSVGAPISYNGTRAIGAQNTGLTGYFNGLIDDIGLWNRALNEQEIADLYISCSTPPTATITALGATTFCQGGFVTLKASGGDTYQWNTGATTASINAMQSSTYSVIVTANGCSATASQSVTVNPNPSVSLAQPANFININANPLTLYGSPSGGTYSGSGVSGSTFNPKTAGLGKSTISYSYTNVSGCIATATQSTIVYDTTGVVCATHINVTDTLFIDTYVTGITPPKNLNTIKVFPNPAKDHITINYGNFASMNGYSLKITNSLGQEVFTTPINQQSSYIDLSKWSGNGVYFVNIIDKQNKTIDVRKIVLQ